MYRSAPVDAPLVVAVYGNTVIALDRRNGVPAWRFALATVNREDNLPSRVWVENDSVIVVSCDVQGRWTPKETSIVSCLAYRSGALRWQRTLDGSEMNRLVPFTTVLVDQGQLLVATQYNVYAFSMENGAPQWIRALDGSVTASREGAVVPALAIPGIAVQVDQR